MGGWVTALEQIVTIPILHLQELAEGIRHQGDPHYSRAKQLQTNETKGTYVLVIERLTCKIYLSNDDRSATYKKYRDSEPANQPQPYGKYPSQHA
jgi:hypothetical protein